MPRLRAGTQRMTTAIVVSAIGLLIALAIATEYMSRRK